MADSLINSLNVISSVSITISHDMVFLETSGVFNPESRLLTLSGTQVAYTFYPPGNVNYIYYVNSAGTRNRILRRVYEHAHQTVR